MNDNDKEFALALSGGGYRATLFSLGSLWRLNEFGLLRRLNRVTSVSGSSIASAYLAMKWHELRFDAATGIASNFPDVIADPLRDFCSHGLDAMAVIGGILSLRKTTGDKVAGAYDKRLFKQRSIRDITCPPYGPEFIFYATSLQTGSSVRISRARIADYKVGILPDPDIPLAEVVGASSAFPPVLSPVIIRCDPEKWQETEGAYLYGRSEFREKLVVTDGGVYDNMGLEAVWNDGFKNVFVCNASAPLKPEPEPGKNWFSQLMRVTSLITDQTRALRKRTLIDNYLAVDAEGNHLVYGGAYWGIRVKINDYTLEDAMVKDNPRTESLQYIRTRLNGFKPEEQGDLINWGYAMTDAALRRYYFREKRQPGRWPVPAFALDR